MDKDIVPHTFTCPSYECFNKTSPTYCLYISDANLSPSVGDGYSVSLAGDASLHSNDYSEEDQPFSVRLRAKIDFFYGYGSKDYIFFTSSSICPARQPATTPRKEADGGTAAILQVSSFVPLPLPTGLASLAHHRLNWVVSNNCGPQGVL